MIFCGLVKTQDPHKIYSYCENKFTHNESFLGDFVWHDPGLYEEGNEKEIYRLVSTYRAKIQKIGISEAELNP